MTFAIECRQNNAWAELSGWRLRDDLGLAERARRSALALSIPRCLDKILRFSTVAAPTRAIFEFEARWLLSHPDRGAPGLLKEMRESFMFEVNPVLNKLKELSERTELLRGYL